MTWLESGVVETVDVAENRLVVRNLYITGNLQHEWPNFRRVTCQLGNLCDVFTRQSRIASVFQVAEGFTRLTLDVAVRFQIDGSSNERPEAPFASE
jgi:hypothetical protein